MMMNPYDEQLALDYVIFMIVGSFFKKATPASILREKSLHMRYQLLKRNTQYNIEEACERYFEKNVHPELPEEFLGGNATVHWVKSKTHKYTAVVFVRGKRQLWITSLYGGRYKKPLFDHWTVGITASTKEKGSDLNPVQ